MLRYKGVLYMTGTDRKMIFQGVHMLMAADLGQALGRHKAVYENGIYRPPPPKEGDYARLGNLLGLTKPDCL